MVGERRPEDPSNIVGLNQYLNDRKLRVEASLVRQDWYTARFINPHAETVNRYAEDMLVRVTMVEELKNGGRSVYATPVEQDGMEVNEDEGSAMNRDGYFFDETGELGYLMDLGKRMPRGLGAVAAYALVEV